jgi:hypothetical protein
MTLATGEHRFQFGGQERVFKFGNNTFRLVADKTDITKLEENIFDFIPYLFWAALTLRKEHNNLPENFTVDTVCDWMDEAGEEVCAELWTEAEKCMGFMTRMIELANEKKKRLKKA